MGHDDIGKKGTHFIPILGEARGVAHVEGGYAVDGSIERIERAVGLYKLVDGLDNLAVLDAHHADGAYGSAHAVGGFEIEGGKIHAKNLF